MNKILAFLCGFLILAHELYSCKCTNSRVKATNEDSIREANLISMIEINTPEFKYFIDKYVCLKKISDSGLHIKLKLYQQQNNITFRKLIVYISNDKSLEYAFPYTDEMLYCDASCATDSVDKNIFLQRTELEKEFNYMVSKLGFNQASKRLQLQRFITLFEDSLLGAKRELSLKDTNLLSSLAEGIHNPDGSVTAVNLNLAKNYRRIMDGLKNSYSVRFFKPYEGFGAYWEFKITEPVKGYSLYVEIRFINKELYRSLFI